MSIQENHRKYQLILLDILDVFVSICDRHKLKYYLNAGTLLGAVRHQGFIPWDDDIDICMPRTDYIKFLEIVHSELPKRYKAIWFGIQGPDEHPQYNCQILDTNVPIVQTHTSVPRQTFAWIDIFPLDGLPDNPLIGFIHKFCLLYLRGRIQLSMFDRNVNIYKTRPWYEKLIIGIVGVAKIGHKSNTFLLMNRLDKRLTKYSESDSIRYINFMGAYKLKEIYHKQTFGKGKSYEFEHRYLNGPENADTTLRTIYGDTYMIPHYNKHTSHFIQESQIL